MQKREDVHYVTIDELENDFEVLTGDKEVAKLKPSFFFFDQIPWRSD